MEGMEGEGEGQTLVEETEGGDEWSRADLEEADLAVDDKERDVLSAVLAGEEGEDGGGA